MLSDLYFFKSSFVICNENYYDLYHNMTLIIVNNNNKITYFVCAYYSSEFW
jgi:hypothetical protein